MQQEKLSERVAKYRLNRGLLDDDAFLEHIKQLKELTQELLSSLL